MRPFRLGDRSCKATCHRTLPANVLLSPSGRIEGKNLSETAIEKKLKDIEEQEKKRKEEGDRERKEKETITFLSVIINPNH